MNPDPTAKYGPAPQMYASPGSSLSTLLPYNGQQPPPNTGYPNMPTSSAPNPMNTNYHYPSNPSPFPPTSAPYSAAQPPPFPPCSTAPSQPFPGGYPPNQPSQAYPPHQNNPQAPGGYPTGKTAHYPCYISLDFCLFELYKNLPHLNCQVFFSFEKLNCEVLLYIAV